MAKLSYSQKIMEAIGDYVLSTTISPGGGDIQQKLLSELNQVRAGLDPQGQAQFESTVYVYNTQRYNIKGTVDQILEGMHPWILQRLVQRFRPLSALAGVSTAM